MKPRMTRRAVLEAEIDALSMRLIHGMAELRELRHMLNMKRRQREALDFVPERKVAA